MEISGIILATTAGGLDMHDPIPWIATQAATGPMEFFSSIPAMVVIPNPDYKKAGIEIEFRFATGCFSMDVRPDVTFPPIVVEKK